jgi:DNA-binding LacI/PurR family transcriptional regulator
VRDGGVSLSATEEPLARKSYLTKESWITYCANVRTDRSPSKLQDSIPYNREFGGLLCQRLHNAGGAAQPTMSMTIKDIARHLDISPATVSRALKDDSRITPEVREKVNGVAKKVGYRPNLLARGLVSSRTHTIGYIVDNLSWSYFSELAECVQAAAEEHDYHSYVYSSLKSPENERKGIESFFSRGVEGLLISATEAEENMPVYRDLADRNFPAVFLNDIAGLEADAVVTDNFAGAMKVMEHLHLLGHREIMFIGPKEDTSFKTQRLAAYRQCLQRKELKDDLVWCAENDPLCGYRAVKSAFFSDIRPSAIFAHNDIMALGVYRALNEVGSKIPDDVSIVGYDDLDACQLVFPPLTSVGVPLRELAHIAVDLLMRRIEEARKSADQTPGTRVRQKIVITPKLVVRQSTAPIASTHLQMRAAVQTQAGS